MQSQQSVKALWPVNPYPLPRNPKAIPVGITSQEYSEQIGCSKNHARKLLEAMVSTGRATRIVSHIPTGKKVIVILYVIKEAH